MSARCGINLIGYVSSNLGLGVVAREFAKALLANGHPVAVYDINAGGGRSGFDLSLQQHFVARMEDLPHAINLWLFGANDITGNSAMLCHQPHLRARFNAAFVWWELPDIPRSWTVCAQAFDAIVTGSEFVRENWANQVPGTPVLMAHSPLVLPDGIAPDRARFGLPESPLLIYVGFEPASDPVRKNPFAAVLAFRLAFPARSDVRLVIKMNNAGADPRAQAQVDKLHALIGDDARVLLLHDRLGYADLLSLYASCDVIVSLHRAEGLGLVPLEAMRLGKAVVATGWSGNMTYMNHRNAALVGHDFVATDETALHYAPSRLGMNSRWAEPRLAHAAAWMRAFADDPALRAAYGQQAAADSARYNQAALRTDFAADLQALHAQRAMRPAKDYEALKQQIRAARFEQRFLHLPPVARVQARVRAKLLDQYDRHVGRHFSGAGS